eukprot:CAMPEP_0117506296 /NCGR_PEP_ID=MMETSP0784-20121206/25835_1 /TAXON_ID=39447 /ORGANISM="" /LENGTH=338 /DNA_ID=CAMNT_0005301765 /DNA_START=90 /DNA_END=1106 /DNA_ORIENTATION=-
MVCCIVVLLLPYSFVARFRALRRVRAQIVKFWRRLRHLTVRSPLFRLFVFCGKRGCCGRLSSRCRQPQALKIASTGCTEVTLLWTPHVPSMNAYHEERYICATRPVTEQSGAEGDQAQWQEIELTDDDVDVKKDGRYRAFIDKLPENTRLKVRICASNAWGRSTWSDEVSAETLARPKDGGFTGPLGLVGKSLGSDRAHYRWTQKRGEVCLKIPIGADWTGRDIRFKATSSRLEILYVPWKPGATKASNAVEDPLNPEQVLLAGPFPMRAKADEVFWEIEETSEDGRHINVQIMKAQAMDKWPCAIEGEGHPHIDVRHVRIFTQEMDALGPGGIDILE